jgi:hypothetical protein
MAKQKPVNPGLAEDQANFASPPQDAGALDDWLRRELLPAVQANLADPSRCVPAAEVRALLKAYQANDNKSTKRSP